MTAGPLDPELQQLLDLATLRYWCKSGHAKRIRENAGIRQTELAAVLKISASALNRWESGQRSPNSISGPRYLEALDAIIALGAELDIDITT